MTARTETDAADAAYDAAVERMRELIASMPVDPGPSQLIATCVAFIESAPSRSDAARAFATAASQLSGGLATLTIAYADEAGLVEVVSQAGTFSSTAADRAAREPDSESSDSGMADIVVH